MKLYALALTAVVLSPTLALAEADCPAHPKGEWLSEDAMKTKAAEMGYTKIKTFKTSGDCYEIYGWDKDGRRVEVYFDPKTAAVVKAEVD